MTDLIDPSAGTIRRTYKQYQDRVLSVGSIVHQIGTPETTYRVLKVNPKNLSLSDVEGRTWRLNRRAAELCPVGTEHSEIMPELPRVVLGTIVRFLGNTAIKAGDGYWVCIGLPNEKHQAKFAKLGGDNNRYWRVTLENVEVVTTARFVAEYMSSDHGR